MYLNDITTISNLNHSTPPFGDHEIISFEIKSSTLSNNRIFKRNWINYSKELLISHLTNVDWQINFDSVQSYWNCFESKLVEIDDIVAPFEPERLYNSKNKLTPPPHIKNKINKRARLFKKMQDPPTPPYQHSTWNQIINH